MALGLNKIISENPHFESHLREESKNALVTLAPLKTEQTERQGREKEKI